MAGARAGAGARWRADRGTRCRRGDARGDSLNGARVYNIRDFGAKGDGKTLDAAAVQAAIDACNREGGGTVLVPASVFHIGTVQRKSNVTHGPHHV